MEKGGAKQEKGKDEEQNEEGVRQRIVNLKNWKEQNVDEKENKNNYTD